MLIDDDPDDQEIFIAAAAKVNSGTQCHVFSDAEEALAGLRDSHELPDLMFVDVNMPKMDGFEFLTEIKRDEQLKMIPVVFYSTTADKTQIEKALRLGASAFITKRNSFESLCDVLKQFLTDEHLADNDGEPY